MQGFRSPAGRDRCKGEFDTAVAAEEEDLPAAVARLLATPKPDAVGFVTGRPRPLRPCTIPARVGMALDRLLEPQSTPELISRVT